MSRAWVMRKTTWELLFSGYLFRREYAIYRFFVVTTIRVRWRFCQLAIWFILHLNPLKISILSEASYLSKNRLFNMHFNGVTRCCQLSRIATVRVCELAWIFNTYLMLKLTKLGLPTTSTQKDIKYQKSIQSTPNEFLSSSSLSIWTQAYPAYRPAKLLCLSQSLEIIDTQQGMSTKTGWSKISTFTGLFEYILEKFSTSSNRKIP